MPLESKESTPFELLPTADVAELACRLWIPQGSLHEGAVRTPGTTLETFMAEKGPMKGEALSQGYGSYVLTREPPAMREGGFLGFTFAKPKTPEQMLTPFNEETIWVSDFEWHAVLQVLIGMAGYVKNVETEEGAENMTGGVVGTSQTTTSNLRSRLEARERLFLIPAMRLPTEVRVREYQSPSAFPPGRFQCDPPVPTLVSFSYLGMQWSEVCLHGRVTVPEQMIDARKIEDFGTENDSSVDWSRGQVFEQTNHRTWQPFIYKIETGRKGGLYTMTTYEAIPPPLPKPLPLY